MKNEDLAPRGPRPMTAFFVSLVISTVLMGGMLLSDRRVLELRRARTEVVTLDRQIVDQRKENDALRAAIDAAGRAEAVYAPEDALRYLELALSSIGGQAGAATGDASQAADGGADVTQLQIRAAEAAFKIVREKSQA